MKIITIIFILLANCAVAQNTGLYGKRTFVEFNTNSHYRLFNTILKQEYMYQNETGSTLTQKKDRFDFGFNIAVGRAGKKGVAVSLELGMGFSSVAGPEYLEYTTIDSWGWGYTENIRMNHEALKTRTITIMPKIEFNSSSNLPVGLNHQIGVGFTQTSIVDKDYIRYQRNTSSNLTEAEFEKLAKENFDYTEKYKGVTLLYAFNIRTPVSKSLMINYGLRYTLNVGGGLREYPKTIRRDIAGSRIFNFINFNLGLTYAF